MLQIILVMISKSESLVVKKRPLIECHHHWVKSGFFKRFSDHKSIQRHRCVKCGRSKSEASFDPQRHHRKRQLNFIIYRQLVSGVSQRRSALILNLNRKTIVRKFHFFGTLAFKYLDEQNARLPKAQVVEFDDLETFEHTKCKPLSVPMFVEYKTRRVLGFEVAQMPAKGLLAALSRKKYGRRIDKRPKAYRLLFPRVKSFIQDDALIKSDQNPSYPHYVKKYFPRSIHQTYKSRNSSLGGQGELKKIGFDPLFSINHSYAKLRADINRLFRKTWCTTKKPDCLKKHIAMMVVYHNEHLDKTIKRDKNNPFNFELMQGCI